MEYFCCGGFTVYRNARLLTYISGSFRRHIAQKYLWSNCLSAWSLTHNKELLYAGVTFAILLSSKGESSKEPHHKKCSQYIAPKIWKLKFWGDKNPIFYAETILSKCINLTSFLEKLVKISWRGSYNNSTLASWILEESGLTPNSDCWRK